MTPIIIFSHSANPVPNWIQALCSEAALELVNHDRLVEHFPPSKLATASSAAELEKWNRDVDAAIGALIQELLGKGKGLLLVGLDYRRFVPKVDAAILDTSHFWLVNRELRPREDVGVVRSHLAAARHLLLSAVLSLLPRTKILFISRVPEELRFQRAHEFLMNLRLVERT